MDTEIIDLYQVMFAELAMSGKLLFCRASNHGSEQYVVPVIVTDTTFDRVRDFAQRFENVLVDDDEQMVVFDSQGSTYLVMLDRLPPETFGDLVNEYNHTIDNSALDRKRSHLDHVLSFIFDVSLEDEDLGIEGGDIPPLVILAALRNYTSSKDPVRYALNLGMELPSHLHGGSYKGDVYWDTSEHVSAFLQAVHRLPMALRYYVTKWLGGLTYSVDDWDYEFSTDEPDFDGDDDKYWKELEIHIKRYGHADFMWMKYPMGAEEPIRSAARCLGEFL